MYRRSKKAIFIIQNPRAHYKWPKRKLWVVVAPRSPPYKNPGVCYGLTIPEASGRYSPGSYNFLCLFFLVFYNSDCFIYKEMSLRI